MLFLFVWIYFCGIYMFFFLDWQITQYTNFIYMCVCVCVCVCGCEWVFV